MTSKIVASLLILSAILALDIGIVRAAEKQQDVIRLVGLTKHEPISEMSGIVKSKRFDDTYWVHNDSGDKARIFAIDGTGATIFPSYRSGKYFVDEIEDGKKPWPGLKVLMAENVDWEDIAVDENHIYIADLGNNANSRRDLGVYVMAEPNPRATSQSKVLKYLPVRYPEQKRFPAEQWLFDSESMFVDNGKLYFLSKHRKPGEIARWETGAKLYRLDTEFTDRVNVLTKIDEHDEVSVVTGADLAPNGKYLGLISYEALWVFSEPEEGANDHWLSGKAQKLALDFKHTGQVEAVCWQDNETLLVTNEQRQIFQVKLKDIPAYHLGR